DDRFRPNRSPSVVATLLIEFISTIPSTIFPGNPGSARERRTAGRSRPLAFPPSRRPTTPTEPPPPPAPVRHPLERIDRFRQSVFNDCPPRLSLAPVRVGFPEAGRAG